MSRMKGQKTFLNKKINYNLISAIIYEKYTQEKRKEKSISFKNKQAAQKIPYISFPNSVSKVFAF